MFERLDGKLDGVDFLNVTDSALARMRTAAIPFAAQLKQRYGIEPLVNFSCRDRNLIAMQADLLGAWISNVCSIVALTGDAVGVGDLPDCKGVFEMNSVGLLKVVETLNSGKDLAGKNLTGAPSIVPGCVVNPNAKNINAEIRRLEKKRDAGARYALSQPVFDAQQASTFLQAAREVGVAIFLGLLPFKTSKQASMLSNVPGIKVPEALLTSVAAHGQDADISDLSINLCKEIAEATKHLVCGFHVVSGATPKLALRLCSELTVTVKG